MPTPKQRSVPSAPDPGWEIKEGGRPPGPAKVERGRRARTGGLPDPGREFKEGLRPPERRPRPERRSRSR